MALYSPALRKDSITRAFTPIGSMGTADLPLGALPTGHFAIVLLPMADVSVLGVGGRILLTPARHYIGPTAAERLLNSKARIAHEVA